MVQNFPFLCLVCLLFILRTQDNVCRFFLILLSIDSVKKCSCAALSCLFFFKSRVLRFLNDAIELIIYTCIHHLYYSQLLTQLTCLD